MSSAKTSKIISQNPINKLYGSFCFACPYFTKMSSRFCFIQNSLIGNLKLISIFFILHHISQESLIPPTPLLKVTLWFSNEHTHPFTLSSSFNFLVQFHKEPQPLPQLRTGRYPRPPLNGGRNYEYIKFTTKMYFTRIICSSFQKYEFLFVHT